MPSRGASASSAFRPCVCLEMELAARGGLALNDLKERIQREQAYEKARSRFMSRRPAKLREAGQLVPSRNEIHNRRVR